MLRNATHRGKRDDLLPAILLSNISQLNLTIRIDRLKFLTYNIDTVE